MGFFGKKTAPAEEENPHDVASQAHDESEASVSKESLVPTKRKRKVVKKGGFNFFATDVPSERPLSDPDFEYRRYQKLVRRVRFEAATLSVLIIAFVLSTHIFKDEHIYLARRISAPAGSEKRLAGLTLPILTKETVASWSMTAVTEILTFNFSNFNQRLGQHIWRFHADGWKAFLKAIYDTNTLLLFKERQLVSTAAPSDPATIDFEGLNPDTGDYVWIVTVPIIRKFVTNNDRSEVRHQKIRLTLVRVPLTSSVAGLGIKVWQER